MTHLKGGGKRNGKVREKAKGRGRDRVMEGIRAPLIMYVAKKKT